jgi:hypothetical protein
MRGPPEDHLRESRKRNLLVEEETVLLQELVLGDVAGQDVVGGEIAAVEGEEEIAEPGVGCLGERVQDRVQE